jgi:chromosome segregation ATPase
VQKVVIEKRMASEAAAQSPGKSTWAQAREESHQLLVQRTLEDLEGQAARLQEEKDSWRLQYEAQEETLKTIQDEVRMLKESLQQKEKELFETQQDQKWKTNKCTNLEQETKVTSERVERVEREADSLREEIR